MRIWCFLQNLPSRLQIKNFAACNFAKPTSCVAILAGLGMLAAPAALAEAPLSQSTNLYGATGLIDLPSAESAPDGNINLTFSTFGNTSRSTLTFQITDRLSGSFRYSKVNSFMPDGAATFDRSFDLSYRFLDESTYLPAMTVGLNDFIGTGIYGAEYLVATKSFGPSVRATAGLGWGRLGSHGSIGSPFGERPFIDLDNFDEGGTINYDQWFRGPMAPFGGVSWQATKDLLLKAEYSSDAYTQEVARGAATISSPWNFGAEYKVSNELRLAAYYLYGEEVGAQLTFNINPKRPASTTGVEIAPLPVKSRPSRQSNPAAWDTSWANGSTSQPGIQGAIKKALAKDGIRLVAMSTTAHTVDLEIENEKYGPQPEALGRTARILTRAMPASVETFVITLHVQGMATTSTIIKRSDLEQLQHAGANAILAKTETIDAVSRPRPHLNFDDETYPRFLWSIAPYAKLSFFDPDNPVRGDLGVELSSTFYLGNGIVLSGSIRKKIIGNLDEATRTSNSTLPHVRSDQVLYDINGDPGIEFLTAAWYSRPATSLYGRVTAGYLEEMFGGISAEVLWKKADKPYAFGAEVNYVVQRDFDKLLGFQDYSVATGHVSAYYKMPIGFHAQLDVGRYLAGDWGATLSLDREFKNGWKVGAYATVTDVSAEEFGEGSFDKGIYMSIPFDWFLGQPTRQVADITLQSLARDGGAKLDVDGRLYELVRDTHRPDLEDRWGKFWR